MAALTQAVEAYARGCQNGSNSVTTTPYRTGLTTADSFNLTSPLSGGALLKKVGGRTTAYVAGSFSAASATVVLVVVFYGQSGSSTGAMIGHAKITLTADANLLRDGTRFDAPPIPVDCLSENYEVRVYSAPSSGNVQLFTWVE